MGKFNSDDHSIYYYGQESLRRNGVALTVNERAQNAVKVKSRSRVWLFATPWITAHQASLSITNSRSWRRLRSIESVTPSNHLILCQPLLLLPPIPPSIRVFQWVNSSHEVAKVLEFQLCNIALYSIGPCFYHQSHPHLGIVFDLAPSLHSFWVISPLISSSILGTY